MSFARKLYYYLPREGQNIILNCFGIKNLFRKTHWNSILKDIQFTEHLSKEEQISYVSNHLKTILLHAIRTVPYYKSFEFLIPELMDPLADSFSILMKFPIITKKEVLENPSDFLSKKPGALRIKKTLTSGTTGTPFATFMSYNNFVMSDAFRWRHEKWAGVRNNDWIARLVGDPIEDLSNANPKKPYRISWTDKRIYLSTFHLNKATTKIYVDVLNYFKPPFITGYPSSLEIFSSFAIENNQNLKYLVKKVLYSSEPMYSHQEKIVTKLFNAPIVGFYGSAERILSACECHKGSLHLSLVDGYVEGQFGILPVQNPSLMTTLMNNVMPLIRFELGDNLSFKNTACGCGRSLPIINPVIIKQEDWIQTPSGRKISSSALTWAFKGIDGIRKSQIIQENNYLVNIHIDADMQVFHTIKNTITANINKMCFGEMQINCINNQNIQLTKSGKTRFVINKCLEANKLNLRSPKS